jgi:hypothetical protein
MSSRYSIKNTVKIVSINKPNQKIRFQIRHPENVYAIIGIAVTCSLTATRRKYVINLIEQNPVELATARVAIMAPKDINTNPISLVIPKDITQINSLVRNGMSDLAGHLTLAIAEKGDVVFTEDVRVDNNDYSEILEKNLTPSFVPREQYLSGKGKFYFETKYLITDSILEGYYEDLFFNKPTLKEELFYKDTDLYQVKVYIRYQTIKENEL